jgi:chaperone required for assembly of F1-ATPase
MSESQNWYVVKENSKTCQILTASELDTTSQAEKWGPYETEGEAIAKRVGLIRAR